MRTIISNLVRVRPRTAALSGGVLLVALGGWISAQAPTAGLEAPAFGYESIVADELREKVYFLASDEFEGRGNGTEALDRAGAYIAEVFEELGLTPAGDDGYFQNFPVDRLSLGTENRLELDGQARVEPGRDYVPLPGSVDGVAEGPVVFVGYGIRAPELDYDDLAGVDLAGRIAVVLDGYPRPLDPESRFGALSDVDWSSIPDKALGLEEAGAVGLIVVQGPLGGSTTSIPYVLGGMQPDLPPRRRLMELAPGIGDPTIPIAVVTRNAAAGLVPDLGSLQASIDASLQTRSVTVADRGVLAVDFERDTYTARNVVARIEGADPTLNGEAILVGAHYDHDGEDNGRIWNGADDNASGTSGLLELAEAFAAGERPRRSILLAAWAAEEKGMLGSRHYVRNPPVPLEDTVVMFQIDMIGRNEDHAAAPTEGFLLERDSDNGNAMNAIGSVFSPQLRRTVEEANSDVGLDLRFRYDYRAQNLIRRSDHWTFLSRRVPALFFFGGLHPDYHTPDDTADKINYPKMERVIRLVYRALVELGNTPSRPAFVNPARPQ